MGINMATEDFRKKMIDLINESGLPTINVILCMDLIRNEVEELHIRNLRKEAEEEKGKKDGIENS